MCLRPGKRNKKVIWPHMIGLHDTNYKIINLDLTKIFTSIQSFAGLNHQRRSLSPRSGSSCPSARRSSTSAPPNTTKRSGKVGAGGPSSTSRRGRSGTGWPSFRSTSLRPTPSRRMSKKEAATWKRGRRREKQCYASVSSAVLVKAVLC